jgi:hypothetical protein
MTYSGVASCLRRSPLSNAGSAEEQDVIGLTEVPSSLGVVPLSDSETPCRE